MEALLAYLIAPMTGPQPWLDPRTGAVGTVDVPLNGTSFILVNRRPDGSSPGWPPAAPAPTEACAQDDAEHSQD
jgi:hypothetical protein